MAFPHTLPFVKQEPVELSSPVSAHSLSKEPNSEIESLVNEEPEQQEERPPFLKSIDELGSLSNAIHTFKCRFEELQRHLDFINDAIESKFKEYQQQQQVEVGLEAETDNTEAAEPTESRTEVDPEAAESTKWGKEADPEEAENSSEPEIQYLCKTMCSQGIRSYVAAHFYDITKLREEAVVALKLAPKPAKLVLDCIRRFFMEGNKAYSEDLHTISAGQASALILECFLLMMGGSTEGEIEIEEDVNEEAEIGAIIWRRRLIDEGGVCKASEIDARALLLFLACFGIPKAFRNEDVWNLLRLCKLGENLEALKGSRVLAAKMPDIIDGMVKNGMHAEAVDVACTFGIGDECLPLMILTKFLRKSTELCKRAKREANSPVELKESHEKELADLQSVVKCLEDHNIDLKLLSGWQIEEKMVRLKKKIANLVKQIGENRMPKRERDDMWSSSDKKGQERKQSQSSARGSPALVYPDASELCKQGAAWKEACERSVVGLVPLDSSVSGNFTSYPAAPSISCRSTLESPPENGIGSTVNAAGVGGTKVAGVGVSSTSSYSEAHGEIEANKVGQMVHRVDSTYVDRSNGQSSLGQSASKGVGFYRSSPSLESFIGRLDFPSSGANKRTSLADLYCFVDDIPEFGLQQ